MVGFLANVVFLFSAFAFLPNAAEVDIKDRTVDLEHLLMNPVSATESKQTTLSTDQRESPIQNQTEESSVSSDHGSSEPWFLNVFWVDTLMMNLDSCPGTTIHKNTLIHVRTPNPNH